MLTMTTDDDSATHSPTRAADTGASPVIAKTTPAITVDRTTWSGRGPQDRPVVASQPAEVHLDPDLEQEQHDPDVGKQLELLVVGDVPRRERGEAKADRQVPDDRRQTESPRQPAGGDGREQDEADLEDGRRGGVHRAMVRGRLRLAAAALFGCDGNPHTVAVPVQADPTGPPFPGGTASVSAFVGATKVPPTDDLGAMRVRRHAHLWSVHKGSSGPPLDERHRFRNRFVGAFALTALVVASMAWFPTAVLAVSCPDNGNLTGPSVSPGSGTTTTAFTFSVTYQDNLGETPDWVRVYLTGGSPFNRALNLQSGSLTTGAVYSRTFVVPAGTWSVTFRVAARHPARAHPHL